jgi:transaldolase/glucose-6-phosphate isomerase
MSEWQTGGEMRRLWQKDASLWTGSDEANWLGWLDIVDEQIAHRDQLRKVADDVQSTGFQHVLLLGMGGSSLCPEVLRMTFGKIPDFPELHVLDSTDPAQVKAFESHVDIAKALFIVSSRSAAVNKALR